jgi:8-oxo-dGTP diphosphatase
MVSRLHRTALRLFRRLPLVVRRLTVRAVAPKYSVGAICVIERSDGRLLLVRQTYRSRWGLPGGLLKRREDPADAARREVAEETGLAIELVGEPAVVVEPDVQRIDVVYRARPLAGVDPDALRLGTVEITAASWFAPDRLPELQPETASALIALARVGRSALAPLTAARPATDADPEAS